jgi:hypothetical protein
VLVVSADANAEVQKRAEESEKLAESPEEPSEELLESKDVSQERLQEEHMVLATKSAELLKAEKQHQQDVFAGVNAEGRLVVQRERHARSEED